jgi:hypothetical protein
VSGQATFTTPNRYGQRRAKNATSAAGLATIALV